MENNLEESETEDKSMIVTLFDNREAAEEAVRELQKSGRASKLNVFGKMLEIQEAENRITTLMRPSPPVVDFCRNQHFLCRMAKKLGCQFCAKK